MIIVSIIIGILSHIFWDAFTHESGYFVNKIDILRKTFDFKSLKITVYKVLQHSSTIVGAFIIFYYYLKLPKQSPNSIFFNSKYWFSILGISILITILRLSTLDFKIAIGNLIVTIIPSIFLGILITSLLIRRKYNCS